MQTWLADDFRDIFAGDFGQAVRIQHIVSEDVNADSGKKTKYETTYNTTGVAYAVAEKDIKIYPNTVKTFDTQIWVKADGIRLEKGDTIILSDENYVVVEKVTIQGIIKALCRKV